MTVWIFCGIMAMLVDNLGLSNAVVTFHGILDEMESADAKC